MGVEVSLDLYSTDIKRRRAAVYSILFERLHNLAPELKQAATIESDEELAILMTQVCLVLIANPRNLSIERSIIGILQSKNGISNFSKEMWDYIENSGSRQILVSVMDNMGGNLPNKAHDFIEVCLNHADPEVRALACEKAIQSGRPTHLAHVLNLITDKDALVSETAYRVINEVSPANMAIMIEYALGSSVEWVLENVAPFLPLLINKELRPIMTKFMYHPNELVAKKVREALKTHTVKLRSNIKTIENKSDEERGKEVGIAKDEKHDIPVVSLKEQMELSRKKREEKEKLEREENEKVELELAQNTEEDNIEFENELAEFTSVSSLNSESSESLPVIEEDMKFIDNSSFEEEIDALSEIDLDDEIIVESFDEVITNNEVDDNLVIDLTAQAEDTEDIAETAETAETETEAEAEENAELEEIEENAELDDLDISISIIGDSETKADEALPEVGKTSDQVEVVENTEQIEFEVMELDLEAEHIKIDTDNNSLDESDISEDTSLTKSDCEASISAEAVVEAEVDADVNVEVIDELIEDVEKLVEKVSLDQEVAGVLSPVSENILKRYPSFIVRPFQELFKPALPKKHLDQLRVLMNQTTAFINSCFLQSCMFFAPPSEVLTKTIKECLRNHLTGAVSLRHMHNFAMSLKQSREKPVFFTFSLAKVMTESSDTNPLLMMRELTEYLTNPVEPLGETIPQAIDGMCEILLGLKSILHNKIVMKTPVGAKEPFADLSGPVASILAEDDRPELDLPPGELILISRDGREALGLFPYFKYLKRRVVFARPSEKEFEILLERLDLQM